MKSQNHSWWNSQVASKTFSALNVFIACVWCSILQPTCVRKGDIKTNKQIGQATSPILERLDSGPGGILAFRWAVCHFAPGRLWTLFEPNVYLGCLVLPGSHAEKGLCPSRLIQMATAGRVWSSFTNGKWQGAIANLNPSSPSPLLWGSLALHQAQDLAAWLDSYSASPTAPSKYPWTWECSTPNQTWDPHCEPTIWSWVLWKLSALWRSAITFIGLVHTSLWMWRHRALLRSPSLCRQKPLAYVLGLAAGVGCRRLPICAEGEAMQHWLTAPPPPTSGNNCHGLIQRALAKQSTCRKGSELMLKWSEIKSCLEQSFPA